MGHDDPRLRRAWLHSVSSEVEAGIDGRLICQSSGLNLKAAFGRLFLWCVVTIRCRSLALNGHGAVVVTCLLSGQQRTSFARSEYFAF
jgi:hypothetical protein